MRNMVFSMVEYDPALVRMFINVWFYRVYLKKIVFKRDFVKRFTNKCTFECLVLYFLKSVITITDAVVFCRTVQVKPVVHKNMS